MWTPPQLGLFPTPYRLRRPAVAVMRLSRTVWTLVLVEAISIVDWSIMVSAGVPVLSQQPLWRWEMMLCPQDVTIHAMETSRRRVVERIGFRSI